MLHCRHMPLYLLIGWGVIDLALFLIPIGMADPWQDEFGLLRVLLVLGQFIALSGWVAIGDRYVRESVAGTLIAPALCVLSYYLPVAVWAVIIVLPLLAGQLLIYGVCLNLPLIIRADRGWRIYFGAPSAADDRPAYQFSIREIMLYTVLVAAVAAAWGWSLRSTSFSGSPAYNEFPGVALTGLLVVFPIPWSIWAAFLWARPLHGLLIALLAACFWGAVCTGLIGDPMVMLFALLPSAVHICHVALLQTAGFRFGKVAPETPPLHDDGPDWENAELWKKYGQPGLSETQETSHPAASAEHANLHADLLDRPGSSTDNRSEED